MPKVGRHTGFKSFGVFFVFVFSTISCGLFGLFPKNSGKLFGKTVKNILEKAEHNPKGKYESQKTNFQTL